MTNWKTLGRAAALIVVLVLVGSAPALAAQPGTATVYGGLSENAALAKAVVNAKVTVAGIPATITGQAYSVDGVPVGLQSVVVTAPGHTPYRATVSFMPGDNTLDVALDLTLKTSYQRYYTAYTTGHYADAWEMVHPDVADHLVVDGRRFTLTRYTRFIKSWAARWITVRYLRVEEVHHVWKTKAGSGLEPRYTDVKCLEYFHRYVWRGNELSERGNSHWLRVEGRWCLIFDTPCLAM
jgi:hypothetical protein